MTDDKPIGKQLREAAMYPAVKAWLQERGYTVFPECWGHDVIGYKSGHVVAVEMKIFLSRKLMRQCSSAALFANHVYAAVKSKPRQATLDGISNHYEFGILLVGESVDVLREPGIWSWWSAAEHARVIDCLSNWTPDDNAVGGVPTLAGCGPAQKCAERIREYLKSHPKATWRDIYREVPNHYAHHRSLRGAMPPIHILKEQPND